MLLLGEGRDVAMKIECPGCKLSGNIDDATVPATGLAMTCPRCKKPFTIEKTAFSAETAAAMLDSCPKCQYSTFSDEKFAVCPKCGLVVADYQRVQLAARQNQKRHSAASSSRPPSEQGVAPLPKLSSEQLQQEEEARRKYGLDKVPGVIEIAEDTVAAGPSMETQLPILIAGWGVIAAALILAGFGVSGIMEYLDKLKEAQAAMAAAEETRSGSVLFFQFFLFPTLSVIFAAVLLVFAAQFLAMKKWSISAMQGGAWAGVGLLSLMKISDMIFWFRRASTDASIGYYAMGVFGDVLLLLLYIAPFMALAEYLKSPLFEKSEEMFF